MRQMRKWAVQDAPAVAQVIVEVHARRIVIVHATETATTDAAARATAVATAVAPEVVPATVLVAVIN